VKRSGDANALRADWVGGILFADGRRARHFVLGDLDLFAAEFGEADILDFEVGETWSTCVLVRLAKCQVVRRT